MDNSIQTDVDNLFNITRNFNHQVFTAANKIDFLADFYMKAAEDSMIELGDKAFDELGNLVMEEAFEKSLMGLRELGIQTSLSRIKSHVVTKMSNPMP